jgi:hypothetical protein
MKGKGPKGSTKKDTMKSSRVTWDGNWQVWTKGGVHKGSWWGYLVEREGLEVLGAVERVI